MMLFYLYAIYFFVTTTAFAQIILPSNSSVLDPPSSWPRFNVNDTGPLRFPSFQIAPIGQYRGIARQFFLNLEIRGRLVEFTPSNANLVRTRDVALLSCDPEDYTGNLDLFDTLTIMEALSVRNAVILYSRTANHCEPSNFTNNMLPRFNGIFTTVNLADAIAITNYQLTEDSGADADIRPDPTSYTNSSAPSYSNGNGGYAQAQGTAVTMIILYSITGVITAVFVTIIVTGAIRAHRHPERYGPRTGANGRGRQSRARGIARAMLETLPIVKFGDQQKSADGKPGTTQASDVELADTDTSRKETSTAAKEVNITANSTTNPQTTTANTDVNNENSDNSLGCSICTEDFQKGEEVRVLPCDHKFHPDCVDPWLLNVSGTCPLCRIDLNTQSNTDDSTETPNAPPLSTPANTSTMQALRAALSQPREERLAALRRFRHERRARSEASEVQAPQNDEERRGVTGRLRDRFRIRTSWHEGSGQLSSTQRADRAEARHFMAR